jgi:hypothetical protein
MNRNRRDPTESRRQSQTLPDKLLVAIQALAGLRHRTGTEVVDQPDGGYGQRANG